jgi:hypothetical protein
VIGGIFLHVLLLYIHNESNEIIELTQYRLAQTGAETDE